ncbi:DUF5131 family protein [Mesorhizobium amorphae]|uniref:DUF5131 family protein n=1 Tax=Mesorhizobium amorphae TaxID=71433 RepID=UPI001780194C|nr:phage Gp37/Gp68 family protein [Mesorhizobium amorphae]
MADKSAIEWTDATWNPVVGCSIVSPGCTHCYAMSMAARIEAMTAALQAKGQTGAPHYVGTTKKVNGHTVWTGKLALAPDHILTEPLAWRTPRRIFVNSMGDLFHEDVPDAWIDKVFAIMALAPQHTFQVLTKRAKRMREYFEKIDQELRSAGEQGYAPRRLDQLACDISRSPRAADTDWPLPGVPDWPLPNVWLGVSAERQREADERVPELLATPAAIRFVSAEPLLGPINIIDAMWAGQDPASSHLEETIDWIIVGGESGPDARPMHPAWARSIRDQCHRVSAPFFFKQWGAWADSSDAPDLVEGREDLIFAPDGKVLGAGGRLGRKMQGSVEPDWRALGGAWMTLTGKKAAGRLLDGVEHNAMPELREVSAL